MSILQLLLAKGRGTSVKSAFLVNLSCPKVVHIVKNSVGYDMNQEIEDGEVTNIITILTFIHEVKIVNI